MRSFLRVEVGIVDVVDILSRVESKADLGSVRISDGAGRDHVLRHAFAVGIGGVVSEIAAVHLLVIVNRTTVEKELFSFHQVSHFAVLNNGVDRFGQPAVVDDKFLSAFDRIDRSVFDKERGDVLIACGRRDRFAQRRFAVGGVDHVLFGGNDRAGFGKDVEGSNEDVVVLAFVAVFFAVFVNGADAFDVERYGNGVNTGGQLTEVGHHRLDAVDLNPIADVEPVLIDKFGRVVLRIKRVVVNSLAILVDADEFDVEREVVDHARVADILNVEVNADVGSGDEVPQFGRRAVDDRFGSPVIDGVREDCKIRRDRRRKFERAHVDGANDAADRQADATSVSGKVGLGGIKRVVSGVDRGGRRFQRIVVVEFGIDAKDRTVRLFRSVTFRTDLRNIRNQRIAQRRRRAFLGVEIVTGSGGDVLSDDRVFENHVSRSGAVNARAVRRFVVGDRNVDERRVRGRVNRAAKTGRFVLGEERIRGVERPGGVDGGAVGRRVAEERSADNIDVGVLRFVDRAAAGRGVTLERRAGKRRGSKVVDRAARERRLIVLKRRTFVGKRSGVVIDRAAVFRRLSVLKDRRFDRQLSGGTVVNRAAVDRYCSVERRVVDAQFRLAAGVVNRAAFIFRARPFKFGTRDHGDTAVVKNRAAVFAGSRGKRRAVDRQNALRIDRAQEPVIAVKRGAGTDVGYAFVVDQRFGVRFIVFKRDGVHIERGAGRVVDQRAVFRDVVFERQRFQRQFSFVFEDRAVFRRSRFLELEVLDGNVRAPRNIEQARIVARARNRQVKLISVRIDAVERERLVDREGAFREFERRAVKIGIVAREHHCVRLARDFLHERAARLVRILFAVERNGRAGGEFRLGNGGIVVNELFAVVGNFVTVRQQNDRAGLKVVTSVRFVDVGVGNKRQRFAAVNDRVAVAKRKRRRFGNDKAVLREVVGRGLAVGKRNDRAVRNDRDVVG